ncbi:putative cytosolic protein [Borrelia duttonii CR2A]|uniref:Plasmid partitioning associated protein-1 n=2 Tax=Borrelia duttonii TaxID=40834 RepID=B5RNN4_BORDL|nr:DUF226 domain-containing protein [Borrelia duttonii]ACH93970.1 plasmid partitioning associated protein-1 [Borrelia duttonii Ly]ETZ17451.1 putative cytosolic protein [Borrelia duttonii CR2A]
MEDALKRLKEKKLEIEKNRNKKDVFLKIERLKDRTIYHTKIFRDFYTFGIDKNDSNKFFLILRDLFKDQTCKFHLFSIKDGDKFLGMHYGYRKPIKNVISKYKENGIIKTHTFPKVFYVEFKFKKGSVFCYIKGIYYFFRKAKSNTKYCKILFEIINRLEKQIYEFYGKQLPSGGIITRWLEKNQK